MSDHTKPNGMVSRQLRKALANYEWARTLVVGDVVSVIWVVSGRPHGRPTTGEVTRVTKTEVTVRCDKFRHHIDKRTCRTGGGMASTWYWMLRPATSKAVAAHAVEKRVQAVIRAVTHRGFAAKLRKHPKTLKAVEELVAKLGRKK